MPRTLPFLAVITVTAVWLWVGGLWGEAQQPPAMGERQPMLAFIRDDQVWLMDVEGGNQRAIPSSKSVVWGTLAWSPDGRKLAFWQEDTKQSKYREAAVLKETGEYFLRVLDVAAWRVTTVFTDTRRGPYALHYSPYGPPGWSRDGQYLYFGRGWGCWVDALPPRNLGMWRVNVSTAQATKLHPGVPHLLMDSVQVSPDGKVIAFTAYTCEEGSQLGYMTADGQALTVREDDDCFVSDLSWIPGTSTLVLARIAEEGYAYECIAWFDLREKVVHHLLPVDPQPLVQIGFAHDDTRVICQTAANTLYEVRPGLECRKVLELQEDVHIDSFSVSGKRIAFEVDQVIWLMERGEPRLMARDATDPVLSP